MNVCMCVICMNVCVAVACVSMSVLVCVCVCVRTFESAHMSGQEDDAQRGGYILLAILHDDGVVKLEGRKRRHMKKRFLALA